MAEKDGTSLLPPSVLFVDTAELDADAKRKPERKLWKFEKGQGSNTGAGASNSICPLFNALVDNKYRIREQISTLDQPHAYFWKAIDIEMPEGRNQVLLQTFRPQHDLDGIDRVAAHDMAQHQLVTCQMQKARLAGIGNDDRWEYLARTLRTTNAKEQRGQRILLVAPRRASANAAVTYEKNNEISSRIHYIARDLCTERILCAGTSNGTTSADASGKEKFSHKFSKPVAEYFINQLVKVAKLCHSSKIFGVIPKPTHESHVAPRTQIPSEILLYRQQGCYHLKLMLGDEAKILDTVGDELEMQRLQQQDLDYIAEIFCNILKDTGPDLESCKQKCREQVLARYQENDLSHSDVESGDLRKFVKAKAILEMEEQLNTNTDESRMIWRVPKNIDVVRAHIEELVREEFQFFQNQTKNVNEDVSMSPHKLQEAIRLSQLPSLPVEALRSAEKHGFLCAARESREDLVEMVALVAPNEPMDSSDVQNLHPNRWPDMIVRFRLTVEGSPATAGTGSAELSSQQASTQTRIEAWHMSGQTIDAWNVFTHKLKSKLLKKSSDEIKRDMLAKTGELLESLKKAIETPERMTEDDVNGLTAHIACMMAYTQAVEKSDGDEKDEIRKAVGDFHKSFNTAWSLRGIPDDCPDWRLEPLKDTSKGGLLMQKEHRQQLVQFVKEEGRKRKYDQDQFALQYKDDVVKEAIAEKTVAGTHS